MTRAPITITADDKLKVEGSDDPELTWEITGGDLAFEDEIVGELTREEGEAPGTYEIQQGTLTIEDGAGNNVIDNYDLTFEPGTFTIIPQGALTTSNFNYFDMDEEDERQQFRLIFTPDYREAADGSVYRLAASNPGQFRYNAFFDATGTDEITLTIPYPFVTQGAMPVHVYDAGEATYGFDNGFGFAPDDALYRQSDQIALDDYDLEELNSTIEIAVDVSGVEGLAIVTIHLDYGPKRTTGWAQKQVQDEDKNPIAYEYDVEEGTALEDGLELINNQDYDFSHAINGDEFGEVEVFSINEFKRNTGIGGLVVQGEEPVYEAELRIYQLSTTTGRPRCLRPGGEHAATVYTDEDGWFLWAHQLRGRTTDFRVELWIDDEKEDEITDIELNAMGYASADFYLEN